METEEGGRGIVRAARDEREPYAEDFACEAALQPQQQSSRPPRSSHPCAAALPASPSHAARVIHSAAASLVAAAELPSSATQQAPYLLRTSATRDGSPKLRAAEADAAAMAAAIKETWETRVHGPGAAEAFPQCPPGSFPVESSSAAAAAAAGSASRLQRQVPPEGHDELHHQLEDVQHRQQQTYARGQQQPQELPRAVAGTAQMRWQGRQQELVFVAPLSATLAVCQERGRPPVGKQQRGQRLQQQVAERHRADIGCAAGGATSAGRRRSNRSSSQPPVAYGTARVSAVSSSNKSARRGLSAEPVDQYHQQQQEPRGGVLSPPPPRRTPVQEQPQVEFQRRGITERMYMGEANIRGASFYRSPYHAEHDRVDTDLDVERRGKQKEYTQQRLQAMEIPQPIAGHVYPPPPPTMPAGPGSAAVTSLSLADGKVPPDSTGTRCHLAEAKQHQQQPRQQAPPTAEQQLVEQRIMLPQEHHRGAVVRPQRRQQRAAVPFYRSPYFAEQDRGHNEGEVQLPKEKELTQQQRAMGTPQPLAGQVYPPAPATPIGPAFADLTSPAHEKGQSVPFPEATGPVTAAAVAGLSPHLQQHEQQLSPAAQQQLLEQRAIQRQQQQQLCVDSALQQRQQPLQRPAVPFYRSPFFAEQDREGSDLNVERPSEGDESKLTQQQRAMGVSQPLAGQVYPPPPTTPIGPAFAGLANPSAGRRHSFSDSSTARTVAAAGALAQQEHLQQQHSRPSAQGVVKQNPIQQQQLHVNAPSQRRQESVQQSDAERQPRARHSPELRNAHLTLQSRGCTRSRRPIYYTGDHLSNIVSGGGSAKPDNTDRRRSDGLRGRAAAAPLSGVLVPSFASGVGSPSAAAARMRNNTAPQRHMLSPAAVSLSVTPQNQGSATATAVPPAAIAEFREERWPGHSPPTPLLVNSPDAAAWSAAAAADATAQPPEGAAALGPSGGGRQAESPYMAAPYCVGSSPCAALSPSTVTFPRSAPAAPLTAGTATDANTRLFLLSSRLPLRPHTSAADIYSAAAIASAANICPTAGVPSGGGLSSPPGGVSPVGTAANITHSEPCANYVDKRGRRRSAFPFGAHRICSLEPQRATPPKLYPLEQRLVSLTYNISRNPSAGTSRTDVGRPAAHSFPAGRSNNNNNRCGAKRRGYFLGEDKSKSGASYGAVRGLYSSSSPPFISTSSSTDARRSESAQFPRSSTPTCGQASRLRRGAAAAAAAEQGGEILASGEGAAAEAAANIRRLPPTSPVQTVVGARHVSEPAAEEAARQGNVVALTPAYLQQQQQQRYVAQVSPTAVWDAAAPGGRPALAPEYATAADLLTRPSRVRAEGPYAAQMSEAREIILELEDQLVRKGMLYDGELLLKEGCIAHQRESIRLLQQEIQYLQDTVQQQHSSCVQAQREVVLLLKHLQLLRGMRGGDVRCQKLWEDLQELYRGLKAARERGLLPPAAPPPPHPLPIEPLAAFPSGPVLSAPPPPPPSPAPSPERSLGPLEHAIYVFPPPGGAAPIKEVPRDGRARDEKAEEEERKGMWAEGPPREAAEGMVKKTEEDAKEEKKRTGLTEGARPHAAKAAAGVLAETTALPNAEDHKVGGPSSGSQSLSEEHQQQLRELQQQLEKLTADVKTGFEKQEEEKLKQQQQQHPEDRAAEPALEDQQQRLQRLQELVREATYSYPFLVRGWPPASGAHAAAASTSAAPEERALPLEGLQYRTLPPSPLPPTDVPVAAAPAGMRPGAPGGKGLAATRGVGPAGAGIERPPAPSVGLDERGAHIPSEEDPTQIDRLLTANEELRTRCAQLAAQVTCLRLAGTGLTKDQTDYVNRQLEELRTYCGTLEKQNRELAAAAERALQEQERVLQEKYERMSKEAAARQTQAAADLQAGAAQQARQLQDLQSRLAAAERMKEGALEELLRAEHRCDEAEKRRVAEHAAAVAQASAAQQSLAQQVSELQQQLQEKHVQLQEKHQQLQAKQQQLEEQQKQTKTAAEREERVRRRYEETAHGLQERTREVELLHQQHQEQELHRQRQAELKEGILQQELQQERQEHQKQIRRMLRERQRICDLVARAHASVPSKPSETASVEVGDEEAAAAAEAAEAAGAAAAAVGKPSEDRLQQQLKNVIAHMLELEQRLEVLHEEAEVQRQQQRAMEQENQRLQQQQYSLEQQRQAEQEEQKLLVEKLEEEARVQRAAEASRVKRGEEHVAELERHVESLQQAKQQLEVQLTQLSERSAQQHFERERVLQKTLQEKDRLKQTLVRLATDSDKLQSCYDEELQQRVQKHKEEMEQREQVYEEQLRSAAASRTELLKRSDTMEKQHRDELELMKKKQEAELLSLQEGRLREIEKYKKEAAAAHQQKRASLEELQQRHKNEMESLQRKSQEALQACTEQFGQQLERQRLQHAAELQQLRVQHDTELQQQQQRFQETLEQHRQEFSSQMEHVKTRGDTAVTELQRRSTAELQEVKQQLQKISDERISSEEDMRTQTAKERQAIELKHKQAMELLRSTHRKEAEHLRSEVKRLQQELAAASSAAPSEGHAAEAAAAHAARFRRAVGSSVEALQQEIERIMQRLEEARAQSSQLETEKGSLLSERRQLNRQLRLEEEQRRRQDTQLRNLELQHQQLQQEAQTHRLQAKSLRESLDAAAAEAEKWKSLAQAAGQQEEILKAADRAQQQIKGLQLQATAQKDFISSLKEQLETKNKTLAELEGEVAELHRELRAKELKDLHTVSELRKQSLFLEHSKEDAQAAVGRLKTTNQQLQKDNAELAARVKSLAEEVDAARQRAATATAAAAAASRAREDSSSRTGREGAALKDSLGHLEQQLLLVERQLQQQRNVESRLREELHLLQGELETKEKQSGDYKWQLRQMAETVSETNRRLRSHISGFSEEKAALRDKLEKSFAAREEALLSQLRQTEQRLAAAVAPPNARTAQDNRIQELTELVEQLLLQRTAAQGELPAAAEARGRSSVVPQDVLLALQQQRPGGRTCLSRNSAVSGGSAAGTILLPAATTASLQRCMQQILEAMPPMLHVIGEGEAAAAIIICMQPILPGDYLVMYLVLLKPWIAGSLLLRILQQLVPPEEALQLLRRAIQHKERKEGKTPQRTAEQQRKRHATSAQEKKEQMGDSSPDEATETRRATDQEEQQQETRDIRTEDVSVILEEAEQLQREVQLLCRDRDSVAEEQIMHLLKKIENFSERAEPLEGIHLLEALAAAAPRLEILRQLQRLLDGGAPREAAAAAVWHIWDSDETLLQDIEHCMRTEFFEFFTKYIYGAAATRTLLFLLKEALSQIRELYRCAAVEETSREPSLSPASFLPASGGVAGLMSASPTPAAAVSFGGIAPAYWRWQEGSTSTHSLSRPVARVSAPASAGIAPPVVLPHFETLAAPVDIPATEAPASPAAVAVQIARPAARSVAAAGAAAAAEAAIAPTAAKAPLSAPRLPGAAAVGVGGGGRGSLPARIERLSTRAPKSNIQEAAVTTAPQTAKQQKRSSLGPVRLPVASEVEPQRRHTPRLLQPGQAVQPQPPETHGRQYPARASAHAPAAGVATAATAPAAAGAAPAADFREASQRKASAPPRYRSEGATTKASYAADEEDDFDEDKAAGTAASAYAQTAKETPQEGPSLRAKNVSHECDSYASDDFSSPRAPPQNIAEALVDHLLPGAATKGGPQCLNVSARLKYKLRGRVLKTGPPPATPSRTRGRFSAGAGNVPSWRRGHMQRIPPRCSSN